MSLPRKPVDLVGRTTMKCKSCGAPRERPADHCEYCGSPYQPDPARGEEQLLLTLLQGWNEPFLAQKQQAEDRAVAIMFAGMGLSLLALALLRLLGSWGWLALIGLGLAGLILSVAVSLGLGDWWARRDEHRLYREQIRPQIEAYLQETGLDRWQMLEIAQGQLGRQAMLRRQILADAEPYS